MTVREWNRRVEKAEERAEAMSKIKLKELEEKLDATIKKLIDLHNKVKAKEEKEKKVELKKQEAI